MQWSTYSLISPPLFWSFVQPYHLLHVRVLTIALCFHFVFFHCCLLPCASFCLFLSCPVFLLCMHLHSLFCIFQQWDSQLPVPKSLCCVGWMTIAHGQLLAIARPEVMKHDEILNILTCKGNVRLLKISLIWGAVNSVSYINCIRVFQNFHLSYLILYLFSQKNHHLNEERAMRFAFKFSLFCLSTLNHLSIWQLVFMTVKDRLLIPFGFSCAVCRHIFFICWFSIDFSSIYPITEIYLHWCLTLLD